MERQIEIAKAIGKLEAVANLVDIDRKYGMATDDHTMKIFREAITEMRGLISRKILTPNSGCV